MVLFIIIISIIIILCLIFFLNNDNFENVNSKIPKVIYMTHKKKIPEQVINNWKLLNPEYQFKFYDDNLCRLFIKNYYPSSYLEYFDWLSTHKGSGPIKGDFWRCLILYKWGGVYVDSDIEPLVPISNFLEKDVDFLTCNSYHNNNLNPHLIISRPNNIILEECINVYVNDKFNLPYKYWDHSIVHIMCSVFKKFKIFHIPSTKNANIEFIINNEKINYKIQLLQEIFPHGSSLHDAHCKYKDIRVLNNRMSNYDPHNHTYLKNGAEKNNLLSSIIKMINIFK